jgi:hypothetical protein
MSSHDTPWKLPVQTGLGCCAQRTSKSRDEHCLSLGNYDRHCVKNDGGQSQRTDGRSQPTLRF